MTIEETYSEKARTEQEAPRFFDGSRGREEGGECVRMLKDKRAGVVIPAPGGGVQYKVMIFKAGLEYKILAPIADAWEKEGACEFLTGPEYNRLMKKAEKEGR